MRFRRIRGVVLLADRTPGHADVFRTLLRVGASVDQVNNLGWTAVIESIALGDGGSRHTETLRT